MIKATVYQAAVSTPSAACRMPAQYQGPATVVCPYKPASSYLWSAAAKQHPCQRKTWSYTTLGLLTSKAGSSACGRSHRTRRCAGAALRGPASESYWGQVHTAHPLFASAVADETVEEVQHLFHNVLAEPERHFTSYSVAGPELGTRIVHTRSRAGGGTCFER